MKPGKPSDCLLVYFCPMIPWNFRTETFFWLKPFNLKILLSCLHQRLVRKARLVKNSSLIPLSCTKSIEYWFYLTNSFLIGWEYAIRLVEFEDIFSPPEFSTAPLDLPNTKGVILLTLLVTHWLVTILLCLVWLIASFHCTTVCFTISLLEWIIS